MSELTPTTLDAIRALFAEMESIRPKTFLLFHTEDFYQHKDKLGIITDPLTGLSYYNQMRIIHSSFAEKGMIRELPTSIIEKAKITFDEPIIGYNGLDEDGYSIKQIMRIKF